MGKKMEGEAEKAHKSAKQAGKDAKGAIKKSAKDLKKASTLKGQKKQAQTEIQKAMESVHKSNLKLGKLQHAIHKLLGLKPPKDTVPGFNMKLAKDAKKVTCDRKKGKVLKKDEKRAKR